MLRSELLEHIYDLIPSEEERLRTGTSVPSRFYEYLDVLGRKDERGIYHLPDSHFILPVRRSNPTIWGKLDASPHQPILTLKRASRFYQEPMAYGDFIAIRYCYSGQSHITTLDHEFDMHANDLCLLSHGFVLSQYLRNEDDLVFTLIFERDYLVRSVLEDVPGGEILARFMLNYICDNKNPQNYIVFHGGENDRIRHVIEDMLCEYIDPSVYGEALIETYVKLLLFEMLGCDYEYEKTQESRASYQMATVLSRIDTEYRTLTLNDLARDMGYNIAYLSRMIKAGTGFNFKDLILNKRMEHAAILLKNSDLSIRDIMIRCGLANETYFYQKFRGHYGCSPKAYKAAKSQSSD